MTEYQLDLLLEYIDLNRGISTESSSIRVYNIKQLLITDIRAAEIVLKSIVKEIK